MTLALPAEFSMLSFVGEAPSLAALQTYDVCMAVAAATPENGWSPVQQALAVNGRTVSSGMVCNLCVRVQHAGVPVGILTMAHKGRRCMVQAIHVIPCRRGHPYVLAERMWHEARELVRVAASQQGISKVTFSVESSCGQSQQAAHFWITRMGWEGSMESCRAAMEWQAASSTPWSVGEYVMTYIMCL